MLVVEADKPAVVDFLLEKQMTILGFDAMVVLAIIGNSDLLFVMFVHAHG